MGFHVCEYCPKVNDWRPAEGSRFSALSSGDVTLAFDNGDKWEMPDMILHYAADHGWLPPQQFIADVMNQELVGGDRLQTRSLTVQVGYLKGEFEKGKVPEGFIEKLEALMKKAEKMGFRAQTKSL